MLQHINFYQLTKLPTDTEVYVDNQPMKLKAKFRNPITLQIESVILRNSEVGPKAIHRYTTNALQTIQINIKPLEEKKFDCWEGLLECAGKYDIDGVEHFAECIRKLELDELESKEFEDE